MPAPKIIHDLPPVTFNGLSAPVREIQSDWSIRLAERAYPYTDAAAHDPTGRQPIRTTVTFAFINTIAENLYPGEWAKWRRMSFTGKIGKFQHPDIGQYDARIESVSVAISPASQSGIFPKFVFVESLAEVDQPTQFEFSAGDLTEIAAEVDDGAAALGLEYPDGMPEPSFEEFVGGIVGQGAILEAQVSGKINSALGTLDRMQDRLDAKVRESYGDTLDVKDAIAGSVERILLEQSIAALSWGLRELQTATLSRSRATKSVVTTADSTLATLSLSLSQDLGDLILLNPALLASPLVPKGTSVTVYVGS